MIKEIISLINTIVGKLFDKSINKKNQETDLNIKTLNMVKDHNLPSIFKNIVEEKQIKLLTGKNVNICFAEKIQNLKIKLGGNFTDEQLYSIEKFYKENANGELYINLSKKDIFLTKFFAIFILTAFGLGIMFMTIIIEGRINDIRDFILYASAIFFSGCICLFILNTISKDFIAINIKKRLEELPR